MAVGITCNNQAQCSFVPADVVFKPCGELTTDAVKRIYWGDNIDVLSALTQDETVRGKVKLIYIDPPYNTGGAFETRDQRLAYADKFAIEDYLDFMEARLNLMRDLMADDGSIYVHLDCNMVFHMKILMDRIFGIKNFQGMITRKKCKSKNYTRKTYGNISDYILFYSKTDNMVWNRPYEKWADDKILKEYPFVEKETGRRYKRVPIHAPGVRNGATGGEWKGMLPPIGKHWQYTPDRLEEMDRNGEIYWSSTGNPRRKVYLDQSNGVPVQDIWLDFLDVNNQNTFITGYPTEKNLDMMTRIIEASSNRGDIVLDCFCGSGTTLVAAENLGRQWIGVDIGEEAIRTTINRFKHGSRRLSDFQPSEKSMTQGTLFENKECIAQSEPAQRHQVRFNVYSEDGNVIIK